MSDNKYITKEVIRELYKKMAWFYNANKESIDKAIESWGDWKDKVDDGTLISCYDDNDEEKNFPSFCTRSDATKFFGKANPSFTRPNQRYFVPGGDPEFACLVLKNIVIGNDVGNLILIKRLKKAIIKNEIKNGIKKLCQNNEKQSSSIEQEKTNIIIQNDLNKKLDERIEADTVSEIKVDLTGISKIIVDDKIQKIEDIENELNALYQKIDGINDDKILIKDDDNSIKGQLNRLSTDNAVIRFLHALESAEKKEFDITYIYKDQDFKEIYDHFSFDDNVYCDCWLEQNKKVVNQCYQWLSEGDSLVESRDIEFAINLYQVLLYFYIKNDYGDDNTINNNGINIIKNNILLGSVIPRNVVFHGAPGTGKTYTVRECVEIACGGKNEIEFDEEIDGNTIHRIIPQSDFVQFHSSYDYSNFVEGLQPVLINEEMTFVKMDGIFKKFCRNVAEYNKAKEPKNEGKSSNKQFYFIIDEINRADIGRVFGELMYGIEDTKRGNGFETQYAHLPTYYCNDGYIIDDKKIEIEGFISSEDKSNSAPVNNLAIVNGTNKENIFRDGFFIPKNVHIIGTMNDIDRSVESIDFALRRRFKWKRIDVNKGLLDSLIPQLCELSISDSEELIKKIISLNEKIDGASDVGLGQSYDIGPTYFKKYKTISDLSEIWNDNIEPILKEYTRGRDRSKSKALIGECYKALFGKDIEDNKAGCYIDYQSEIESSKNIVFHGAPGTGKTTGVEKAIQKICGSDLVVNCGSKKIPRYKMVQFHSSYDYTTFVEGLQPLDIDEAMSFVKMDGIFKKFCRDVAEYNKETESTEKQFYFIIDEINRADLGRVFGELMYGIEEGYRGKSHTCHTQYENLKVTYGVVSDDVFSGGFYVPENIHIIGTMNDIDRSVESIDFAMRRRFKWIEVTVNEVMMKELLPKITNRPITQLTDLINRINKLNSKIEKANNFNLDSSYCIGPGYFKYYTGDNYTELWNDYVEQIIIEYTRGRKGSGAFIDECKAAFTGASN